METIWIILAASLAAISCSLIGSYLVVRKIAMMADAITHAVLPGIVTGFLLTGSKSPTIILIGATSTGMLASWLVAFLEKKLSIQSDASIGINFTWLFALGVVLISLFSRKIDLDPDCVLYGEVAYVPLHTWQTTNGLDMGPAAIYKLSIVLLINLIFILTSYKHLFITSFDPSFANAMGIHTNTWHYALMAVTSLTSVASFEIAGSILVVALFVVPPSIAYLLTKKLPHMLVLSSIIGCLIAFLGYLAASWLDGSISGAMVTISGILFFTTWIIKTKFSSLLHSCIYIKNTVSKYGIK